MPKRILQGVVLSDKQDKTVVVKVERRFKHPVLKKTVRRSKNYDAHDQENVAKTGDNVSIQESRPSLRGGALVAAFHDDRGLVSFDRVVARFGLSKLQFAETIAIKRDNLNRTSRLESPKTQARITGMLEIVGRVADWAGGERQALAWYRAEPLAAFGGRTAEALVKEGRAAAVRDYLDHVAAGGFA